MSVMFNPVQFIEEVKARPALYKNEHPIDRCNRLDLWKQVGAALFADWASYSKATAYDRVLQLQKKWRSLRDAYNRELRYRKSTPNRSRRPYRYFKRMTFLGGFEGEISPAEDMDDEDEQKFLYPVHELNTDDDRYHNKDDTLQGDLETAPIKKIKKRKRKRESSGSIQAAEEYEMPLPIFTTDITETETDSDKQFLLSFLPEMRQLPVNIKMWARAQIANIMQEAVNNHYNNTTPGSSMSSSNIFEVKRQRHEHSE